MGNKIRELELNFHFRFVLLIFYSAQASIKMYQFNPASLFTYAGASQEGPPKGTPPRPSPSGGNGRPVRRRKHLESPEADQPLVFSNDVRRRYGTHGN